MWNPFSDATQGAVKGLGDAVKVAVGAFKADPTKVVEFETSIDLAISQFNTTLITAQAKMVESINQTMQAESKSEHWLQYSWRPMYGYTGILLIIHNYILASYFAKFGLQVLVVPSEIWYLLTAVVGVTAYTRGQAQIETVKNNGK